MSRTYPYKAWVIQPSGKPKEVTLVETYDSWLDVSWDISDSGKSYHIDNLHPTKDAAIAAGLDALDAQQANLTKRQTTLEKKRATLIAAREQP
ncbi:hypothetical protein CSC62_05275 [Pseudoxanthomonas jiangsuensis]|uniref:hypothetical protein n=1 Tax=Pseudoxanthomonas jiangsuensis TaxID=619688 RepID=UPI0013917DF0|nr:hypothetical protein [Pseudoxanthomonas jiangsuensis]KAF1698321.1 hypothetical protein CSC62_05275 [Pseudoxanthomonas jiangsuensis]